MRNATFLLAPLLVAHVAFGEGEAAAPTPPGTLCIERGAAGLSVCIPRAERLEFEVTLGLGIVGNPTVGRMTLETGVEAHRASPLLAPSSPGSGTAAAAATAADGEVVWIRSVADGGYLHYEEHHEMLSRHLPEAWPATVTRLRQTGSHYRRRELLLGTRDGQPSAEYRSTGHCKGCKRREHYVESTLPWGDEHHCEKCRRPEHIVWKDPAVYETPGHFVDMLTSLYLPRTLLREGVPQLEFLLVDRRDMWLVTLRRAERKVIEVPAGSFEAIKIRFDVRPPPSAANADEEFEGLFGVHGQMDVWVEAHTGVLLRVQGEVPVGPFDLTASISLEGYSGTPAAFAPRAGK